MFSRSLIAAAVLAAGAAAASAQTSAPTSPNAPASGMPGNVTPGTTPGVLPPGGTTGSVNAPMSTDVLYSQPMTQMNWRVSDLEDQSVYNQANERIGEINEIILDNDGRVVAVLVGVGGFLGIGERDVAVNFKALQVQRENNGNIRVVVNMDRAQLERAPAFQAPNNWRRS